MTEEYKARRRSNTAALRRAIKRGWIRVDVERGIILKPSGKPIHVRDNGCGYLRFKIQRGKCRQYFVHKAVYLASGKPFRIGMEIDHIDDDSKNNRGENLTQLSPARNREKSHERAAKRLAEHFPVPF